MPKVEPHFDVPSLLHQVREQDLGLFVTTNNPGALRRIIYTEMRREGSNAGPKISIISIPDAPNRLMLLTKTIDGLKALGAADDTSAREDDSDQEG